MKCLLCPRKCGADREKGEFGFCGAGDKIKIARAALHFWEEPCLSGKSGSGAVFFSHCTLKCIFCQNYKISADGIGYELTDRELADVFLRLMNEGANNINLVTPTHYVPHIIKALDIAKSSGMTLPIVYNCGGYESVETIRSLKGYIDIYLPDMKYYSDKYSYLYSGVKNYFNTAKAAISEMYNQVGTPVFDSSGIMKRGMIVRHMMLPSLLFDTKRVIDYLFDTYGDNIYISLMSQYTPMPQMKNHPILSKKVSQKYYNSMVNYCMEKGMTKVFIQEGESASESFIPFFSDKKE